MTDLGRVGIWSALDGLAAEKAVEFAVRVEELGYGALWVPEAVGRDPFATLGFLAARTTRLVLGTSIASVWGRTPTMMRAAANGLGELSGGRLVLGLGVSHQPMVEGVLKENYDKPLAKMSSFLDAYAAAVYMGPQPPQPVPVLIAALGPKMLELSRDKADGAYPYLVTPDHMAVARAALGPDKTIAVTCAVSLETDPSAAREAARGYLRVYLGLPNYLNNLRRLGFTDDDVAPPGSDRLCDAIVAWGGPDKANARIAEFHDAGADHVGVIPLLPNGFMPDPDTVEALALSDPGGPPADRGGTPLSGGAGSVS